MIANFRSFVLYRSLPLDDTTSAGLRLRIPQQQQQHPRRQLRTAFPPSPERGSQVIRVCRRQRRNAREEAIDSNAWGHRLNRLVNLTLVRTAIRGRAAGPVSVVPDNLPSPRAWSTGTSRLWKLWQPTWMPPALLLSPCLPRSCSFLACSQQGLFSLFPLPLAASGNHTSLPSFLHLLPKTYQQANTMP